MLSTAAAALIAVSTLLPTGAESAEEVPAPLIEVVTVNGSGCRAGDADVSTSGRTFTVGYHEFFARAGGDSAPTDFRKNCQINLRVDVPDGWTYGLSGLSHRGYAHLREGSAGLLRTGIYFQGSSETTTVNRSFAGPYSDDFQVDYWPDVTQIEWAPCGAKRNLNVNTEARVTTTDRESLNFIFMESTRGVVRVKRC